MQAIARANRVYPGKTCGIIVDYVNVFKYMKKALTDYAAGEDATEFPAKDIEQLIGHINGTIDAAEAFLLTLGIELDGIMGEGNTIDDEKVARARQRMNQLLDDSVQANEAFNESVHEAAAQYMIKGI